MRTNSHLQLAQSGGRLRTLHTRFPALRRLGQPLRFGVVGLSGVVVNSAVLWLLVKRLGLAVPLGSGVASEVAIISNFLLNDRWTFRATPGRDRWWQRFLRFNGVALGGLLITAALLTLLTAYLHLALLPANLVAVGAATGWNYIVNSRWTWRGSDESYVDPARSQR